MTLTRRLFHFTTSLHLPSILDEGMLRTTESNCSRTRPHAGPDVLWLTSSADVEVHQGWQWSGPRRAFVDKTEVRFTVEVPKRDVYRWWDWAARRGIDQKWARQLAAVGGSRTWWVIERPVTGDEWIEVIDVRSGEPLAQLTAAVSS